tara:strand:+ start:335 stop:712 length:378 start_codon:yes stop_codon:yes gene_type:complete
MTISEIDKKMKNEKSLLKKMSSLGTGISNIASSVSFSISEAKNLIIAIDPENITEAQIIPAPTFSGICNVLFDVIANVETTSIENKIIVVKTSLVLISRPISLRVSVDKSSIQFLITEPSFLNLF